MGGTDPRPALADAPCAFRVLDAGGGALPLAAARNLAAASTDARQLVFLDVDCVPAPGLVRAYRKALETRPALLLGDVRYLAREWAGDPSTLESSSHPHPARPPAERREAAAPELLWSLSFAVDRECWLRTGGFDEAYAGYGAEDTDLGFSARARGVAIERIPGAVAYHQWHESFDPPLQHLASIVDNARRFHAKWGSWPMGGWLRAFADAGLVDWDDDRLLLLREPTPAELAAARS